MEEPKPVVRKPNAVVIRHASDDKVVAVIEIVSPGNKASQRGFDQFVKKAAELIQAGVHLLVVDLFPPTAAPARRPSRHLGRGRRRGRPGVAPRQAVGAMAYSCGDVKRAFIEPVAPAMPCRRWLFFLTPDEHVLVPLAPAYDSALAAVPARWRDLIEPSAP